MLNNREPVSIRADERVSINFFKENLATMHSNSYCFSLQLNHHQKKSKETGTDVIQPSSPFLVSLEDQLLIILQNIPYLKYVLMLGID